MAFFSTLIWFLLAIFKVSQRQWIYVEPHNHLPTPNHRHVLPKSQIPSILLDTKPIKSLWVSQARRHHWYLRRLIRHLFLAGVRGVGWRYWTLCKHCPATSRLGPIDRWTITKDPPYASKISPVTQCHWPVGVIITQFNSRSGRSRRKPCCFRCGKDKSG